MLRLSGLQLDKIPTGYKTLGLACGVGIGLLAIRALQQKVPKSKTETETSLVPGGREMSAEEWMTTGLTELGILTNCYVHFVESRQPVTKELVTRAAQMMRARHPLLRMRVDDIIDEHGKARHYFIPMEEEVLDIELIAKDDWQDVHTAELLHNINSKTGPLWRIKIMPNNEENGLYQTILFVTFSHAIIDGNIMMRFIDELLSNMSLVAEGKGDLPVSLPMVPHALDTFGIQRITWWEWFKFKFVLFHLLSWHQPVNLYLAKFGVEIARNPNAKKETRIIPLEFSQQETSKILEKSRCHKATVSGTLAAAAAVAISQIMQDGVLKSPLTVPTSFATDARRICKPPLDATKTFAIYAPLVDTPIDMKVEANARNPDEFWRLAAHYTKETHSMATGGWPQTNMKSTLFIQNQGYSVDDFILPTIKDDKNGNRFGDGIFFFSNLGNLSYFTRETPRIFELTRRHCACEMSKFGSIFCHYICTFDGRLFWSLTYYSHVTTRERAQEYANLITDILTEMCAF
ncbi:uncharacterized protein LOC144452955 [Glandiceps talaboti]